MRQTSELSLVEKTQDVEGDQPMYRPVLIVIDMLNDFHPHERLVQSITDLLLVMRRHGYPVIWVRQEFDPDLHDAFLEMKSKRIFITIKGTAGYQIIPQLEIAPSETVIVKKRYSAFFGTELESILANLKPDIILLAGINTHACVRMTAIDAYQRDWPVVIASDCVGSYDEEHHAVTLRYLSRGIARMMTNKEITATLLSNQ
jgi:nicotinamidase-related amidase